MSIKEEWRPIKGYEGFYEVSSHGRVRSLNRVVKCKDGITRSFNGQMLRPIIGNRGYIQATLRNGRGMERGKVHRLVAQTFIPNPQNLPQVNHIDGNKQNNHVDNLEWCTCQENIQHAHKTGLAKNKSGADSLCSKLTWEQVREIRTTYRPKDESTGTTALAKKYGVAQQTISKIVRNQKYYDKDYCPPNINMSHCKLTMEQAEEIRKTYIPNDKEYGVCALARRYGVAHSVIVNIIQNKTYQK